MARAAGGLLGRAPNLRNGSERLVAAIVKALQTMAGPTTTVEGMVASFDLDRAREVVATHRPHAAVGAIALQDLSRSLLLSIDATLVHGLVELLCGGCGAEPPAVAPRAVTAIDQQFAQIVFTLAASAIQTEWADYGVGPARVVKLEGPLTTDVFGTRDEEVGIVNLTIGIFGLHGTLRLVLPGTVLDRFSANVVDGAAAADGGDPHWASLLREEIGRAPVALAAYLDAKDIPLSSLTGLKVGQILALPQDARSRATLLSDGRVLYRGEIGQADSHYSLRIDEIVCEPANVARRAERRAQYFDVKAS